MADPADFDQSKTSNLGYEPDQIKVRPILIYTVILILVVLLTCFAMAAVMAYFSKLDSERQQRQPPLFADEVGQYTGPRLQESPTLDMQRMKEKTTDRLNSYGWVDPEAGIVHIPIAKAIELLAQPTRTDDPNHQEPIESEVDRDSSPAVDRSQDNDVDKNHNAEPKSNKG